MAYIQDWGMRVQAQPQINTTRRAFLHLSQNENGRMLNIRITDANIPTGSTAVLAGTKPDGTVYSQAGTLAGNTATFAEDVQMTAVAGTWDAKITVTNGGNCICTARITITIDPDTVAGGAVPSDSQLDGIIAECRAIADSVRKEAYGSPLVADAVEAMTDQSRVYVYTGSESGMTAGHWYYYNGTAWTDGGVYNAVAVDTDTTLSIAGAAADAKKVGDELADVKEGLNDIIKDVNTSSLWEQGGISSSNGTNSTGTNRLRTVGYVESNLMIVPANGYKYIICAYDTSGYVGMWDGSGFVKSATWFESKINLSDLGNYNFRLVFSKTSNASITVDDYSNVVLMSLTDLTLTQKGRPADAQSTGNAINAVKAKTDSLFADFNNLSPTLDYSGYINSETGNVSSSEYAKCTDFVDIGDFDTINWNTAGGNSSVARVAFYNSEKAFLSAINTGTSGTVNLTDGAYSSVKYVRFSYYDYPNKVFSAFTGTLYKKDSIKTKVEVLQMVMGTYKPSNVLIFGDSITDCAFFTIVNDKTTAYNLFGTNSYVNAGGDTVNYKMWPKIFGQYVPCAEIRNYARSGASYKDQTSPDNPRRNLSYQITLALNDLSNENGAFVVDNFVPDVIIFALGTNDGQPNDTPADAYAKIVTTETGYDVDATLTALDRTKFCEAVLWAYFITRKHFPFALTLCVLPTQRMSDDYPIGNARTYLAEIAQRYGGAVLVDGAFSSGIVKENNVRSGLGATLKDGLHPNDKGQNLMARLIIGAFKQYYVPFDDMNP